MTLDELAKLVMETYAAGCDPDELDRKAARAVLLAVADEMDAACDGPRDVLIDEWVIILRRIAGEG